jgi:hypothetical protein
MSPKRAEDGASGMSSKRAEEVAVEDEMIRRVHESTEQQKGARVYTAHVHRRSPEQQKGAQSSSRIPASAPAPQLKQPTSPSFSNPPIPPAITSNIQGKRVHYSSLEDQRRRRKEGAEEGRGRGRGRKEEHPTGPSRTELPLVLLLLLLLLLLPGWASREYCRCQSN